MLLPGQTVDVVLNGKSCEGKIANVDMDGQHFYVEVPDPKAPCPSIYVCEVRTMRALTSNLLVSIRGPNV